MKPEGTTKLAAGAPGLLLAAAALLAACDRSTLPVGPGEAAFHHEGGHPGGLVERAWGEAALWELVKPRPPGLGAPAEVPVHLYIIAPVDEADPLSPPIHIPGVITVGGRDHVVPLPGRNGGSFGGVARSVPVSVPGWEPFVAGCGAPAVDADRIAWRWVETPHPCGRQPLVYAVRLEGEACLAPLTSIDRVRAAVDQRLAVLTFPPEAPWPFAVRPLTRPGQGRATVAAPACVG